jgi:hypothetical protein
LLIAFKLNAIIEASDEKYAIASDGQNRQEGDTQIIGHRIDTKDSILLCGEFSLPKPVFSVASWMGQVAYGSCASKGFDAFETSISLNLGIIGTIRIDVFKRVYV